MLMAGCLGIGEDGLEPATADDAPAVSEATRALQEAGYADPYLGVEPTGEVKAFDFWVDDSTPLNPHGDKETFALSFAEGPDEPGQVPGPEIRVKQGDTVRVTLHSPGPFEHTIHWHGLDVPWKMDGVPFVTQDVEATGEDHVFTYEFVAKQAGTHWYHCVVSFPADSDLGLFGALIVEPHDPDQGLPYDRDETLMFHETDSQWLEGMDSAGNDDHDPDPHELPSNPVDAVDSAKQQARTAIDLVSGEAGRETGEYLFAQGPRDYYPQWSLRYQPYYDTFMINGKSYPDTEPVQIQEGETLRLRLINAGQLHKSIHLHGHHVLVTHLDGYPISQPHWEDTLNLAPGERKDVYVQGTNPGIWSLHDHSGGHGMGTTSANDYAFPGGMKTVLAYEGFRPDGNPAPAADRTAGELAVYAPSYKQSGEK